MTISSLVDVLWRDTNPGGNLVEWNMNGPQVTSSQTLDIGSTLESPDASWSVAAVGDFGGTFSPDLLWRNTDNTLVEWNINGNQIESVNPVTFNGAPAAPDSSWSIVGAANFGGVTQTSDLLWQNTDGTLVTWLMSGGTATFNSTQTGGVGLPTTTTQSNGEIMLNGVAATPNPVEWSVAGLGDFNGDGKTDILWRDKSTNQLIDWTMQDSTTIGSADNVSIGGAVPDSSWSVAGVGDFNGDGKADVLWRNTAGTVVDWTMNGSQVASEHTIATVDPSWQVAQIGDFNGDGKADVLWRNTLSGAMQDWTMNGSTIVSNDPVAQGSTPVGPASYWATLSNPTHQLV
jgi:hypothetical protein